MAGNERETGYIRDPAYKSHRGAYMIKIIALIAAFLIVFGLTILIWPLCVVNSGGSLPEWITALSTFVIIFGVFFAGQQVKATNTATKAQVLLKLIEEWRAPELYESIVYVHEIRREWKNEMKPDCDGAESFRNSARKWVEAHISKNSHSKEKIRKEWQKRRTSSQFLAKMGSLITSGHLTPDELFRVVPEAPRLLIVLLPIEEAILDHYRRKEAHQIGEWDIPSPKWEFRSIWVNYKKWHKTHKEKYDLPESVLDDMFHWEPAGAQKKSTNDKGE